VAVNWRLPLREAKQLIELAYYAEARRRGYKLREVAELLSEAFATPRREEGDEDDGACTGAGVFAFAEEG
jgi:hypothetical protein